MQQSAPIEQPAEVSIHGATDPAVRLLLGHDITIWTLLMTLSSTQLNYQSCVPWTSSHMNNLPVCWLQMKHCRDLVKVWQLNDLMSGNLTCQGEKKNKKHPQYLKQGPLYTCPQNISLIVNPRVYSGWWRSKGMQKVHGSGSLNSWP